MTNGTVRLSDYKLASYLVAVGYQVTETDRQNDRVFFVFHDTPALREAARTFRFGNPMVPVRDFLEAQSFLRSLIFDQ